LCDFGILAAKLRDGNEYLMKAAGCALTNDEE
jgi:hypothetical protein